MRHTKIIATVGPASGADDMLDALIAAGTDIFRLNFSHGTQQTQGDTYARVRAAAKRSRREVAILQDLAGPKIRTGTNKGGWPIAVKPGERLLIATGDFPGEPGRLSTTFAGHAHSVRPGDRHVRQQEIDLPGKERRQRHTHAAIGHVQEARARSFLDDAHGERIRRTGSR